MKTITLLLLWLFCVGAGMSQVSPKVGVYVTGEVNAGNKKIVGQKIVSGMSAAPDLSATDRTVSFLSELAKSHDYKVNVPVDETRIIEIGRQFGLDYVVVAELTDVMGELVISSKMMNVQGNTQFVSAENIVKVRQASDLMMAAEDIAKQLLDNLYKLHGSDIQQAMQENAVVAEPAVQQASAETLSLKSRPQRINIHLVDNDNVFGNGKRIVLSGFIVNYIAKLSDYDVIDSSLLVGYEREERGWDYLLVIEVNKLSEDKIIYAAKLLDVETACVVVTATLIGNNEIDAYQRDCEKLLDELTAQKKQIK